MLSHEIRELCADLRSDSVPTRFKAIERLDKWLTNCTVEHTNLLELKTSVDSVIWNEILEGCMYALMKHASRLDEQRESKTIQTLRNKNNLFSGVVNKIIEFNMEYEHKLVTKQCIFTNFTEGFKNRCTIVHFNELFLNILERGILQSAVFVRQLKVSEYSLIISHLFELNVGHDERLRFTLLRTITHTIELAARHVQLQADFNAYLPDVVVYARKANDERRRADVLKLLMIMIKECGIDYHQVVCQELCELLPIIADFYEVRSRTETKELLFPTIYIALRTIYAHIDDGDYSTLSVLSLGNEAWTKCLRKLRTLVDMEVRERKLSISYAAPNLANNRCRQRFVQMSALVTQLCYWHLEANSSNSHDEPESRSKIAKTSDPMERVLQLVQPTETSFEESWLAILAELLSRDKHMLLNVSNHRAILESVCQILPQLNNGVHLLEIRRIATSLLHHEAHLKATGSLPADYCEQLWRKIIDFLIGVESFTSNEAIHEKELLLQQLLLLSKIDKSQCEQLLNLYMSKATLRRNICLQTVRLMLLQAEQCGIDKSSDVFVGRIIVWAFDTKLNVKHMLRNVAPIEVSLIADTCAIAVINFLQAKPEADQRPSANKHRQLLMYKKNRQLVCLQEHATNYKRSIDKKEETSDTINCFFQGNYDLLMRSLQFETSAESTCRDILNDLASLQKLLCLMQAFLRYDLFTTATYMQCPLIKRIGFFLNHLEFQLKNNKPREIVRSQLMAVLTSLEAIFKVFNDHEILVIYLEAQNLQEVVKFVGTALNFFSEQIDKKVDDCWDGLAICLNILAHLCASKTHCAGAWSYIINSSFELHENIKVFLNLIKIFCLQRNFNEAIAEALVGDLQIVFKMHHTNIEIVDEIVDLLPAMFKYMHTFEEAKDTLMVALKSLMTLAYKKSYTSQLTAKLLQALCQITRQCSDIVLDEQLEVISYSAAKFLASPSLQVQFACINTLTALLDANWPKSSQDLLTCQAYYEFCQNLIDVANWKDLLTKSTENIEENCNAVIVQYLLAVFCFSAYHQQYALREIIFFCALRKLKAVDVPALQEISKHFQQPLVKLTKPYMSDLIHSWTMKQYPIVKFPYFLCHNSLAEFIDDNLALIGACVLIYDESSNLQQMEQLYKYANKQKILKACQPLLCAFVLPQASNCREYENKAQIKNLLKNCKIMNIDPLERNFNFRVIYHMLHLLRDNSYFQTNYQVQLHFSVEMWYDLNYLELLKCLKFYMKTNTESQLFVKIIEKSPLELIRAIGDLKRRISECFFPLEKLHHLCLFCLLADLIIDSLSIEQENSSFFARDILLYVLQFYQNADNLVLRETAKKFLNKLLQKQQLSYDHSIIPEYKQQCDDLRQALAANEEETTNRLIATLCENTPNDSFKQFFTHATNELSALDESHDDDGDLKLLLESIVSANCRGIEGLKQLRQTIGKFKRTLQSHGKLCCNLIKSLIDIVHNGDGIRDECSLEAGRCLGELGALKIKDVSFYLIAENALYAEQQENLSALQNFSQCLLRVLEKCLLAFKTQTYEAAIEVAAVILNSVYANKLLLDFPYLCVFHVETATPSSNYLDIYSSLPPIDWLAILKACESHATYENWICAFMPRVFASCSWPAFEQLCLEDGNFADAALEALVKLLLDNREQHLPNLLDMLNYFFDKLQQGIGGELELAGIYRDKRVACKFLNICECIRLNNDWKVPVNLLHVAVASNHCQAYFMSIMYLEMWSLEQQDLKVETKHMLANGVFQACATRAYQAIDCRDAISGFLNPLHSRMDFLSLNNDWSDMVLEANGHTMLDDKYIAVLKRNGMFELVDFIEGKNAHKWQHANYEVCWRLSQWDTPVEGHARVNCLNNMDMEFEKHHFNALKCLHNLEENNAHAAIANARQCVLITLQQMSVECLQNVYKHFNSLQMLQQAEDFSKVQFANASAVEDIFVKWKNDENLSYGSFRYKEQLLAHKIALFKTAGVRANRKITAFYKDNPIENCLLHSIKACKHVGEINLTKCYIASLRNMNITNEANRLNMLLEDAEMGMKSGKREITRAILEHVLTEKEYSCCLQRVRAYRMQGEFLMESNSETFANVMKNYFNNSLKLIDKIGDMRKELMQRNPNIFNVESYEDFARNNKQSAYETIAKYADREYTQLNTYINSDEYQMKCQIIEGNRKAISTVGRNITDRDRAIGVMQLKSFANLDEHEVQNFEQKRTENLCIAVSNYIKYCCFDDGDSSPSIYRIIGLWFANKLNANLRTTIAEHLFSVPSHKFICALNQITARLSSTNGEFLELLKKLLVICMQDHPQQTLYQLLPLVFAFTDAAKVSNSPHNRVAIAKEILGKAKCPDIRACIKGMEQMFPALIEFANVKVTDTKATNLVLSEKLKRLKNLTTVQCPTIDLPVTPTNKYTLTTIVKWDERVTLVGGINVPKKLKVLCSNGKTYCQLLKGMDDLRQDAVMQQVFTMINDLLQTTPETVERKLALRTYKVVPLSMRSGILEWCENTIPLGLYLADHKDEGAHKRYHPNEYTVSQCRKLSMTHLKSDAAKRHAIFTHICGKITPVFQYFFFEKFLAPGVWFERRLAYINSVATTSIVGFILGIGDRHARNILIDEKTGEVIHIDFGIAFEQGKIQPTPERVPFRLTRDMVAPMGVCKTGGVFKKSCEATMKVLRHHQAIITTILEVLLYDPLYSWKVINANAVITASKDDEEKNLMAQRALLCVQNKLEGKQAGIIGVLNVDVQVERLINEATSYNNLCLHYPGWDPYL